jgi:hypothetical protein
MPNPLSTHVLVGHPVFGNHAAVIPSPIVPAPGWLGSHQLPPAVSANMGGLTGGPNAGAVGIPSPGVGVPGPAPISSIAPHAVTQAVTAAGVPNTVSSTRRIPVGAIRQLQNVTRCLRAAQDLRYLSLSIPDWSDNTRDMYGHIFPDGRPIFYSLGLWQTWPKLRSLSLEGIYADEQDLIDFVKRHGNTLRALNFTKCSLCTGR